MPTSLRLYTDRHIHRAITDELARKGVDIVRCEAVGLGHASDLEHMEYAAREGRAVVTGDKDFMRLAAEWRKAGKNHAGIFYIQQAVRHLGKGTVGIVVRTLLFYHEAIREGAATLEDDIHDHDIHIGMRG